METDRRGNPDAADGRSITRQNLRRARANIAAARDELIAARDSLGDVDDPAIEIWLAIARTSIGRIEKALKRLERGQGVAVCPHGNNADECDACYRASAPNTTRLIQQS